MSRRGSNGSVRPRALFAIVAPFQAFFRLEAAGGVVLVAGALVAVAWANSPWAARHEAIFHALVQVKMAGRGIDWTVQHLVNEGLMTLFFVVAGIEIKRELVAGELASVKQAALPLVAALGGMIVPALVYLALNGSDPGRRGWGVPTATDIAFSLGCLSLVRRRVPSSVFVLLTALAIFDDLGAMVVIACFYGGTIRAGYLLAAAIAALGLVALGRARVQALWLYAIGGVLSWAALLPSGIHPAIAGVVVGLSLPTAASRPARDVIDDLDAATTKLRREMERRGTAPDGVVSAIERHLESVQSALDRTMHGLHGVVAFGIVPLFAIANAAVVFGDRAAWGSHVTLGAFLGLFAGKPLGVLGAGALAVRFGLATRPASATTVQLVGAAIMSGIGFTMSLFIGNLAFGDVRAIEDQAKLGVLAGSFASAGLGLLLLRTRSPELAREQEPELPVVLDVPRFARGYGVRDYVVPAALIGKTIAEIDVRRRFGVTVIGMWRGDGSDGRTRRLEPIDPNEPLGEGVLLVAGADAGVDDFIESAAATLPEVSR